MSSSGPLLPVFLVDDNADDLFVMRQRLLRAAVENPIVTFDEAENAVAHLKRAIADGQEGIPSVVFLDLRMPRRGGFEVLKWIRSQPALSDVRVFIVSTSALPEDAQRSLQLGAVAFLSKYPSPEALGEIVRAANENRNH